MKSRHSVGRPEGITDPASQFDEIALLYDELMAAVAYADWIEYVERILYRFAHKPSTVLDLCCGTGNTSLPLAEKGYRVSGVDVSPGMISAARQKSVEKGIPVDYYVQDVSSLDLGRRFDLIVSLFDSLNYILESAALQQAFYRISQHLEPGGLLIFDVNTELALAGGLFDQSNPDSRASVLYDWRSSYDRASRICSIRMEFVDRRRGDERRVSVVHYQRAYDEEEIVQMLGSAGLEVLAVYDGYTFRRTTGHSDRAFFVARK